MSEFTPIGTALVQGLDRLVGELLDEMEPTTDQRGHIMLLTQLMKSLIASYLAFQFGDSTRLDASTSVMYAAAGQKHPHALNVPLRSLVEDNSVSPWQARYMGSSLGAGRTILVTGTRGTGRSTLLNALVQLLPVDERIVAIEETEQLAALHDRAFTIRVLAKPGSPDCLKAIQRAAEMKPRWLLVGDLVRGDGPAFLEALKDGASGLATVETPDPEVTLNDWLSNHPLANQALGRAAPLIVHLDRDRAGRPRVLKLLDVTVTAGQMRVTECRPA